MEKSKFLKLGPMLLHEEFKPFNRKDYLFEIKYDGIRALIYINKNKIIIKSRRNIILNDTFPELLEIQNISKDECIFDGEIVLLDDGKPNFSLLQERVRLKNKFKINEIASKNPVTFVCFDILHKDKDLTGLSLVERKKVLERFKDNDIFVKSKYFLENGKELFKWVQKEDLEGIIAKRVNSKYTYGIRTKEWIKIKNFKEEEFYICGYNKTKSNNVLSVLLGEKINNKYIFVGKVLYSYKNKDYENLLSLKKEKSYLENCESNATFVKPEIKIKVNYMERTKNNMLRQPFIKKDKE